MNVPGKRISRKEKTAFHEAGHAVAAYLLRKKFRYVTIRSNGMFEGYVMHGQPGSNLQDEWEDERIRRSALERDILISLAGGVVNLLLTGKRDHLGSYTDLHHALDLADHVCGSKKECTAYVNWLFVRCEGMVKSPPNWHAVETLAGELLKREKIPYRKAREIIQAAKKEFRDKKNHV